MQNSPDRSHEFKIPRPKDSDSRTTRRFSTIDDFVNYYKQRGSIASREELLQSDNILSEVLLKWIQSMQCGCAFAGSIAKTAMSNSDMGDALYARAVYRGNPVSHNIAKDITTILDAHVAAGADALQLALPRIKSEDEFACLLGELAHHTRWYWVDEIGHAPSQDQCCVGLRWTLPCDTAVNPVLGFASLPLAPITRQSPIPALVLRTQACDQSDEDVFERKRRLVHLAFMTLPDETSKNFEKLNLTTSKMCEELLVQADGTRDRRGKAHVTFTLPRALVEEHFPAASECVRAPTQL